MDEESALVSFDPCDPVAERTEAVTGLLATMIDLPDDLRALGVRHIEAVTRSIEIEFPPPKLQTIPGGKRTN